MARLLWISLLAGCSSTVVDISTISFDKSAYDVDNNCIDGCGGDLITATITVEEDISAGAGAELTVRQYRIDYTIPALSDEEEEVPYFAAALSSQVVGFGEELSLTLQPVGNTQRAWVFSRAGSAAISASAVLTIEGHDQQNTLLQLESDAFTITFSDVAAATGSAGGSDTGL